MLTEYLSVQHLTDNTIEIAIEHTIILIVILGTFFLIYRLLSVKITITRMSLVIILGWLVGLFIYFIKDNGMHGWIDHLLLYIPI